MVAQKGRDGIGLQRPFSLHDLKSSFCAVAVFLGISESVLSSPVGLVS